jgi:hypothetical protein
MIKTIKINQSLFSVVFAAVIIYAGCATQTGTKIEMLEGDLSNVHNLGVSVIEETGFKVMISQDEMTGTGAVVGGMIGMAIEHGIRSYQDEKIQNEFDEFVQYINIEAMAMESVMHYLKESYSFYSINDLSEYESSSSLPEDMDAVLEIVIKEWGLHRCPAEEDMVQMGFNINSTLTLCENNRKVWERNDHYYSGKCYALQELEEDSDLFHEVISKAIEKVSGRIVYELVY